MSFGGISSFKAFKLYIGFLSQYLKGPGRDPSTSSHHHHQFGWKLEGDSLGQDPHGELVRGIHGKGGREHTGWEILGNPFLPTEESTNSWQPGFQEALGAMGIS